MPAFRVSTPDGVEVAAQSWGNASGRAIVFIHGYGQCHLSWQRQFADAELAREFRIVTYDLRGHGESDKPTDHRHYREGRPWAAELAAVIAAAGLQQPVLVGWSYGGRVICDYLQEYGDDAIGGINFADASTSSAEELYGTSRRVGETIASEDLSTRIATTRAFLRSCFEVQPAQEDFETMLAFTMVVPPKVRAALQDRVPNPGPDVLSSVKKPVLITHGVEDSQIAVAMAQFTASEIPHADLSLYAGIGHAPFWEDAARFNRELAEFMRSVPE
jgi:non-heme chloroperoxidase